MVQTEYYAIIDRSTVAVSHEALKVCCSRADAEEALEALLIDFPLDDLLLLRATPINFTVKVEASS